MTSPSKPPLSMTLREDEGNIVEGLLMGHAPTTVTAIMRIEELKKAMFTHLLQTLSNECSSLCQKTGGSSLFRKISLMSLSSDMWNGFMNELESKAPTLLHILVALVSFSDLRNISKVGTSHHPSICAAVAVLLKERNREMCGLQSLVSVLLYSCHCEKQVCRGMYF